MLNSEHKVFLAEGALRSRAEPRYRAEERELKLWMSYADLTDNANEVFVWLKSQRMYTHLALFWGAWSFVLEMADLYSAAAEVLAEAHTRAAVPATMLEELHRAFDERMCERIRLADSVCGTTDVISGAHSRNFRVSYEKSRMVAKVAISTDVDTSMFRSPCRQRLLPAAVERRGYERKRGSRRDSVEPKSGSMQRHKPHILKEQSGDVPHLVRDSDLKFANEYTIVDDDTAECLHTENGGSGGNGVPVGNPHGKRDTNDSNDANSLAAALSGCKEHEVWKTRDTQLSDVKRDHFVVMDTLIRDPFNSDQRKRMTTDTKKFKNWISSSSMVHCIRHDKLSTQWSRNMRRAKFGSQKQVLTRRFLGHEELEVLGLLGDGSFATVYSCRLAKNRQEVAVKVETENTSPSLPWECFIVLQLHRRLLEGFHGKDLGLDQLSNKMMLPDALFLCRDGCAMIMSQGLSGTLHDLVAAYVRNAQPVPQLVVMHYALEMLQFCRGMHSVSILHMDIKPDNWLLTASSGKTKMKSGGRQLRRKAHSLSLIDFGKAIDLSVFPQNGSAIGFSGCCCATSFSCPAMIEGLSWKHDADLFALGSCIYFMLHGVYLEIRSEQGVKHAGKSSRSENRWRPAKPCKRYWEVELWDDLFEKLLNTNHLGSSVTGAATVLAQIEDSLTGYIEASPQRSRELQDLLRRQDNMLQRR